MRHQPAPDSAAMEVAHQLLHSSIPLDQMLQHAAHRLILTNVARRHMQRRDRLDLKKLQANDND